MACNILAYLLLERKGFLRPERHRLAKIFKKSLIFKVTNPLLVASKQSPYCLSFRLVILHSIRFVCALKDNFRDDDSAVPSILSSRDSLIIAN